VKIGASVNDGGGPTIGTTVVDSDAELFARFGSNSFAETRALFVIVPAVPGTVMVSVTTTLVTGGMSGRKQRMTGPRIPEHTPFVDPPIPTRVAPAGSVFSSVTPVAVVFRKLMIVSE
jgi:hypothetical protein